MSNKISGEPKVGSQLADSVPRWIKIKLRKAIHYIHNEDDYEKGMDLIAELAGIEINETGAVQTTVSKLLEQNNQRRLRSVHNT